MQKTNIEYLDYTVSPIAMRCSPVSAGCASCWHLKMCDRFKNNPKIPMELREIYAGDRPPEFIPSRLDAILKHKKPAVIGLQFMGDLFHEDVMKMGQNYGERLYQIHEVMKRAYWHTFIILTKRPQNMAEFHRAWILSVKEINNLWLGVSVEDQATADERIPFLLQIPAALHIVSYEPALDVLLLRPEWLKKVGFLIAGCESGPNRRPAKIEWFRDVKNQCVEVGIPFFLKQMTKRIEIKNAYSTGKYFDKVFKMPVLDGRSWAQLPKNRLTGG